MPTKEQAARRFIVDEIGQRINVGVIDDRKLRKGPLPSKKSLIAPPDALAHDEMSWYGSARRERLSPQLHNLTCEIAAGNKGIR